jgi:hypothetical protein
MNFNGYNDRNMGKKPTILIKRATSSDAFLIAELYNHVYRGQYADPMMSSPDLIMQVLSNKDYHWIIAKSKDLIVASVVFRYDEQNTLAKVYGAVVHEKYRGKNLTEKLIHFGFDGLKKIKKPAQVLYAVTRTVSPAPQKLTLNLGFKKVGIFPNVHKTDLYETHGLTVILSQQALESRFQNFELHPAISNLFEIVRKQCGLPRLEIAKVEFSFSKIKSKKRNLDLEAIHAPGFVIHRFNVEKKGKNKHNWYFPFHEPNLLLTSPDQKIEVFCYLSAKDKHCVIIGVRDVNKIGLQIILNSAMWVLHEIGARYIELILRADDLKTIDTVIKTEFIPCAYFPAMYLSEKMRYDFVVFSRSFEILNFKNMKLDGVNKQYLLQYFNLWKETSIGL